MPRCRKTPKEKVSLPPKHRTTLKEVVHYVQQLEDRVLFLQARVTVLQKHRAVHHKCLTQIHHRVKQNTEGVQKNTSDYMELQVEKAKESFTLFDDVVGWDPAHNWIEMEL